MAERMDKSLLIKIMNAAEMQEARLYAKTFQQHE